MGVNFRPVGSGFENLGISITTRSRLISAASSVSDSSFVIVAAFLHLTLSHYEFCDVQSQHFSNKSERTCILTFPQTEAGSETCPHRPPCSQILPPD